MRGTVCLSADGAYLLRLSCIRTEDGLFLAVLHVGTGAHHGTKVVVVDALLVGHHELAPSLLASLALHLVLINGLGGVELRKILLEVREDVLVELCQTDFGAWNFLKNSPVDLHVLDDLDGELLLDLQEW